MVTQEVEGTLGLPLAPPPTASGHVIDALNAVGVALESLHAGVGIEGELQVLGLPEVEAGAIAAAVPPSAEDFVPVRNYRGEAHRTGVDATVLEETLFEAPLDLRGGELIQDDSNPEPSTNLASQADLGRGQRKRKLTSKMAAIDNGDENQSKTSEDSLLQHV